MNKEKHIIEVLPYDPLWSQLFEAEATKVKRVFSDNFIVIHHIGSTSVRGLAAKPTIDMLMEVKHIERVDAQNEKMKQLGYEALGEWHIMGRRFFIKGDQNRTHHLHIFEVGHLAIFRHLCFREYLKTHPKEAESYSNFKIDLAHRFTFDRQAYTEHKNDYVKELEKRALGWCKKNQPLDV